MRIDPVTLREEASDPERLQHWCREHPGDPITVAALRILGRYVEAEAAGARALAEGADLDPVTRAVRRARWAHVLQDQGRFAEAESAFTRAAEETGLGDPTQRSGLLALASVLQHRGKCRWAWAQASAKSRGDAEPGLSSSLLLDRSREDLLMALRLRENLGTGADQLASTRAALSRIEQEMTRTEQKLAACAGTADPQNRAPED